MRRFTHISLVLSVLFSLIFAATVSAAPTRADRGPWAANTAYAVNDTVTYSGCSYKVLQAHTSLTGWEPPIVPALFQQLGCGTVVPSTATRTNTPAGPTATRTRTNTPGAITNTPTRTATRTNTPVGPTATRTRTNTPPAITMTPSRTPTSGGGATCAVKNAPTGKVLQGYWESWDNSSVHPGMGYIPIGQVPAAYNVIMAAFPVILPDGTALWQDGMDVGVNVPTPQEMCDVKAAGHWVLLSIGGATAAVDLSSTAAADKFIATIVPILKTNNFDGIDIDIESGLVAGPNYNTLSTSQANLIRIIDGVLAQMPSNFMLTMAPETAYVTGGQIAYGGPWGAYLPIIGKYRDNGRLNWLNMQYYNGSMYGCPGTSYNAGTVQGFVEQTKCINNGFQAGGVTFSLPYSKQVPGLPAQIGAGGGYMSPADVAAAYSQVSGIKGLMTWSINWDGSKGWTFMNTKPY